MATGEQTQIKQKKKKTTFVKDNSPALSTSDGTLTGLKEMEIDEESREFDWDTVNDDPNLELWVVRIPAGLKPKYLDKMSFPLSDAGSTAGPIARITAGKKQKQYELSFASSSTGAEELKGMTCLLPRRKKGGKLYAAQKPLAGQLLISEPSQLVTEAEDSPPLPLPSSARYSHPPQALKHHYIPTGVSSKKEAREAIVSHDAIEGDTTQTTHSVSQNLASPSRPGSPIKHGKKRKKDEEGQDTNKDRKTKSKKAKTERE